MSEKIHSSMSEKIKPYIKLFIWVFLFIFLISYFVILPVYAQNITADETTETSILWNLTGLPAGINISTIAFDGILINNYYPNVSYLVQNNLYPNEAHIITIIDDAGNKYEDKAYTIESQQTTFLSFINQWVLIMFVLIIFAIAILSEPMIGFIGIILAFIGLTTTLNYSFELGSIFVILIIAGFFISVRGE